MVSDVMDSTSTLLVWSVLILVLMEYGLGHVSNLLLFLWVLILVLMEYGLGQPGRGSRQAPADDVLILVLMEYGLGQPKP